MHTNPTYMINCSFFSKKLCLNSFSKAPDYLKQKGIILETSIFGLFANNFQRVSFSKETNLQSIYLKNNFQ